MEIVNRKRRNGGSGHERTTSFSDKKVKYNFNIDVLNLMCSYIISSNSNIKKSHIINMRNLFDTLDLEIYQRDIEKLKRINFIRKGIQARLEKDLKNTSLILTYINGGISDENIDIQAESLPELSNAELAYINETISGALKCTFIENDMDDFFDLYSRYKAEDYRDRDKFVGEFEDFVKNLNSKFRNAKAESMVNTAFSLEPEKFATQMSDVYDTVTATNRFISCGMQGLNTLVGGAFEATRTYLLLGMAGIGKSMLLLNLAYQMKKYNKGYQPKDPTKTPTILFLTQENSIEETVDRLCDMITGKHMAEFSKEEVIKILQTDGELTLEGDNNINIHIIWRADRSIDTGDLYGIIEDLEDDGYEVIALIQDHIKRIRSVNNYNGDMRLELGAVVNEFKILAQLKEIPVITVSHLNRDAASKLENATRGNKVDLTRLLGRSNIGESLLMLDNADCVIIANKEFDENGNAYICLALEKIRNATPKIDYICQPFEQNSQTKLVEDLYTSPVYKLTLRPENQINSQSINMNGINMKKNSYTGIDNIASDGEEPNIFSPLMNGTRYSSSLNEMVENVNIDGENEEEDFVYVKPSPNTSINVNTYSYTTEEDENGDIQVKPQPLVIFNKAS